MSIVKLISSKHICVRDMVGGSFFLTLWLGLWTTCFKRTIIELSAADSNVCSSSNMHVSNCPASTLEISITRVTILRMCCWKTWFLTQSDFQMRPNIGYAIYTIKTLCCQDPRYQLNCFKALTPETASLQIFRFWCCLSLNLHYAHSNDLCKRFPIPFQ